MARIHNSIVLSGTPEEAFDYLSDLRSEYEYSPNCEMVEKITDGPVGEGTKYRAQWKRTPVLEVEITDYQRPHTWTTHNGGSLEITYTGTLESVADGTRLSVDFDAKPHGWFRLVFPVFMLLLRRQRKANMERLREAFEEQVSSS